MRPRIKRVFGLQKVIEKKLLFSSIFQKLESKRKGYESAFKDATNLGAFLKHFQRITDEVKKQLIEDIFGCKFFSSLEKDKKVFLGLDFV